MINEHVLHIRIMPTAVAISEVKQQFAALDGGALLGLQTSGLALPNVDAYYSLLTPRRVALLSALRQCGPTSIRALAQQVVRDYKNVHTDIVALIEAGLVERDAGNEISTPWDRFDVSFSLQDLSVNAAA